MSSDGWKKGKLSQVCIYGKDKININDLQLTNYISTENMLPEKAGVTIANGLPRLKTLSAYKIGDVLVSNIRPYFKKIWFANKNGGCSNDVLVFRAKRNIYDSKFLYYNLSYDSFFDYSMSTSKGTKMPRGDKSALMNYIVPLIQLPEQKAIAATLSCLDDMIELNNRTNQVLEEMAQAIFKEWFVDFEFPDENGQPYKSSGGKMVESELGEIPEGWKVKPLGDCIEVIDNRGKTPPLSTDITDYPVIDVKALSGNSRIIDYGNCNKYVSRDIYVNWFRSGHPKNFDILLSTVGNLAQMKLFFGDMGCIAQNVVGFRSQKLSPFFMYEYLRSIRNDLMSYDIGSVQPSIKITHILKHLVLIPNDEFLFRFHTIAHSLTLGIYNNYLQGQKLFNIRDTLLPKLISGEIRVPIEEVV